ncbi:MAG TPA: C4-dicarboxylate ABC transporter permease [Tistrella mobilis]|uniref:C4-dicarboxylate ABC transporter permease n=1 Tax=Tistrella mobilis TaxID=171437 RepID=A0A3B9IMI1_9PROT|nr:C4-dicarboxylate ABC transporter permease [Tistrella mobilis]
MSSSAPMAPGGADSIADGVDAEVIAGNQRVFTGRMGLIIAAACILYTGMHIYSMNVQPIETWVYRLLHVSGGLMLGFLLFASRPLLDARAGPGPRTALTERLLLAAAAAGILVAAGQLAAMFLADDRVVTGAPATKHLYSFGYPLIAGTGLALLASWMAPARGRGRLGAADTLLALAAVVVGGYIIGHADFLRIRAQVFPHVNDMWAAVAGIVLILELTRRLAGLALVVIVGLFLAYGFIGPWLPGVLNHRGYAPGRFFAFIYTDNGILGPTTAISSTYIILFIAFAAFLQASRVGEYFVNFAFAAAGAMRGGPAKVAVFASGLMGMINGTSAGNVVSTGSLTIPLMKKVGYRPQTAASVEAAASSGGQIMPPIMGAGAFIMAEITGIPYTEIAIAAIIPAILYFASVFFMVDFEAKKLGMRGMRSDELPNLRLMMRQVYLFAPIIILIVALFQGYSVIRAGTLATVSAAVVSWISPNKMGLKSILRAFEIAAYMSIQIIVVCAAAGIIVGVISLTGVGARFSVLLLDVAAHSHLLALVFAMFISILLGMGMPTTAAYAVAASVVAPGLVQLGIEPLTAHFFVFYFAVVSAITPPVALASYAAAGISGANAMSTSVASFRIGIAAFIVPFMFFYNGALLMEAGWVEIARALVTATFGVYLLSAGVLGWFARSAAPVLVRLLLVAAALMTIEGGVWTDLAGIGLAVVAFLIQRKRAPGLAAA